MVPEIPENFKPPLPKQEIVTVLILIVVACASFALGHYSAETRMEKAALQAAVHSAVSQKNEDNTQQNISEDMSNSVPVLPAKQNPGGYVASKEGTKYHLPWCGGAQRIKEENKIWFDTKEEAEAAGYQPAANCKGI